MKRRRNARPLWHVHPTEWKGERAKQLLLTVSRQGQTVTGTFYYAESPLRMLGMEFKAPTQSGWMRYKDQKNNPKLPNTLGDPPTSSAARRPSSESR